MNLVITALSQDNIGTASKIAKLISDAGCNILNTRMVTLGSEFAISIQIAGNWSSLAKLEAGLPAFQKRNNFELLVKRTEPKKLENPMLVYSIQIIGLDNKDIIYEITNFFATENISIHEASADTYTSSYTNSPMFSLNLLILVPGDIAIYDLRERFMLMCDDMNLDAVMEPVKT